VRSRLNDSPESTCFEWSVVSGELLLALFSSVSPPCFLDDSVPCAAESGSWMPDVRDEPLADDASVPDSVSPAQR
jgi:hypothetical protein